MGPSTRQRPPEVLGHRPSEGLCRKRVSDRCFGPEATHRASRTAVATAFDCRHKWDRRDSRSMTAPNRSGGGYPDSAALHREASPARCAGEMKEIITSQPVMVAVHGIALVVVAILLLRHFPKSARARFVAARYQRHRRNSRPPASAGLSRQNALEISPRHH